MSKHLLLLALSLALVGRTYAGTVMDSFNDVANATVGMDFKAVTTVAGAGGMGFSTGYEQTGSAVDVLRTNDLVVSGLPNYVSGQSASAKHWSIAATVSSSGAARRTQTRSITALSGTIWFSFLASLQTPNGDVALIFNGTFNNSGVPNNVTNAPTGLRIGLGSSTKAEFRGALGVGPLCTMANVSAQGELTNIINGINGAVTAAGVVPTDGTPVLVLGKISYDSTGYPRVEVWLNPNAANEASLPAPTVSFVDTSYNIVPTSITRIGYQVVRASPAVQNEVIDNVKLSDEFTGFDVVYRHILPTPVVNVYPPAAPGSETGPTNITFTVTTDRAPASPLTVSYSLSGVATNGADGMGGFVNADYTDPGFNGFSGSVTIAAGKTNATVVLSVLDDALPEGNESVVITLNSSGDYLLGGSSAASSYIVENNDANVAAQYMFTRTMEPQVFDPNLRATTAVVPFNTSYSGAYFVSPDAAFVASGDRTPATEAGAVSGNAYVGFTLAPAPGYGMTLTNLQFQACYFNHLYLEPGATGAVVFVRCSLDNFTANLANWVLLPDNATFPDTWQNYSLDLGSSFANLLGNVEFRIYFYDDTTQNQVGVRLDNLYLGANTYVASSAQQVTIVGTVTNAAEPATPAQFTLSRAGDTASPLTVYYNVSGTASNGVDYVLLPGSVTIPAGQSSVQVAVTPIDDEIPESTETVVVTLAPNANYGVLSPATATAFLADDGDIGGLVAWFFNESNNGAGSLSAVAAPTMRLTSKLVGFNAVAGPGLGLFGANNGAGVGHGYGTGAFRSGPSAAYIQGAYLANSATDAVVGGDYISLSVSPVAGQALTLTNFSAWMALSPGTNQTAYAFLRSSLDNFASDLGLLLIPGNSNTTASAFVPWNVPLAMPNNAGPVEFRVYVYCTRTLAADIIRLDDVILQGTVGDLPAGAQVVTVAASTPNAAEPSTPGAFTLTRFGDSTAPLTVNYTIGGTASNGVDYATLAGTAAFGAGASSLVIPVTVLDDQRPEPTETVVLTVQASAGYSVGWPATATVNIADDNDTTPVIALSASDNNAFERSSNLFGAFTLSRPLGDTTLPVTVNFTLGGTAKLGVDYVSSATNSLTLGPGVTSITNFIYPIDNALVDGDRTVTLSVESGSDFILDPPTSATVAIVDDETPTATVLWSDNFDAGTSAANYTIRAGSDMGVDDYVAEFAFDYSTLGVPAAPHSANTTIGVKLSANQLGTAAGVNLYPTGGSFSGDFALRFDLFLSMDPSSASPDNEVVLFGINQSGLATNWQGAGGSVYTNYGEGIFASIATRDGAPNIFNLYALGNGTAPTLVANQGNQPALFNSPPYATAGRANNAYDSANKTWVDCELSQVAGVVTLKLNNSVILQYTNTGVASGNIFLGYDDPWASLGSANCFALIDNVRVVAIAAPATQPSIKQIVVSGGGVTIDFTGAATDVASGFKLQSAASVEGTYADDASAVITGSAGKFQATTAANGAARFYRIRR